eukprot:sb/3479259/
MKELGACTLAFTSMFMPNSENSRVTAGAPPPPRNSAGRRIGGFGRSGGGGQNTMWSKRANLSDRNHPFFCVLRDFVIVGAIRSCTCKNRSSPEI